MRAVSFHEMPLRFVLSEFLKFERAVSFHEMPLRFVLSECLKFERFDEKDGLWCADATDICVWCAVFPLDLDML